MAEGWYQLRQTVHLFNSELFAFDIHLVSDNAAKIPRRRADVKIEKLWQRSVGHFRKADGGTFWRAPKQYGIPSLRALFTSDAIKLATSDNPTSYNTYDARTSTYIYQTGQPPISEYFSSHSGLAANSPWLK